MPQVIGGSARATQLKSPYTKKSKAKYKIRVATNRLKQGVFSTLGPAVREAVVLDLYCGIGSFGIEALSRGAKSCDFVDIAKSPIEYTRLNLEKTHLKNKSRLFNKRVQDFIVGTNMQEYRIVFIDPPFNEITKDVLWDVISRVVDHLTDNGLIVIKHDASLSLDVSKDFRQGRIELVRDKKYGRSKATIYIFYKDKEP